MAAEKERTRPEARTPLDGLAPRDFFTDWPTGELAPPEAFRAYPFETEEQRDSWLQGIELYRELVLDYRHYVALHSRQKVAKRTGLSTNALSAFNGGARFPKVGTYLALRVNLPEQARVLRRLADQDARAQAAAESEALQKVIREQADALAQQRLRQARQGRPPR